MQGVNKYYFDRALKDNSSYDRYYKETRDLCYLFPYSARGSIRFQDMLYLPSVGTSGKYFDILIEIIFKDTDRLYKLVDIQELSVDEYLEMVMEENDYKEAYDEILKYLR